MDIENQTHRVMTGASLQALWPQALRNGLQIANNGANRVYFAWGHPAEQDASSFYVESGQVWTYDARLVPRGALHLNGTAGDIVVLLESCGG